VASGETLAAVGARFGVSRERVRQVVHRAGVVAPFGYRAPRPVCTAEGCERPVTRNGRRGEFSPWCRAHRKTMLEHGTPLRPARVLLRDQHGTLSCYRYFEGTGCRCELCVAAHVAFLGTQLQKRLTDEARRAERLPHGTASGYTNWRCVCEQCRKAYRAYVKERRRRLRERGAAHPELVPHGTPSGYYWWGCHCEACRAAERRRARR